MPKSNFFMHSNCMASSQACLIDGSETVLKSSSSNGNMEHLDNQLPLGQQAISLARRFSLRSVKVGRNALYSVGSYLGVTNRQQELEQWEKSNAILIKGGDIGLQFKYALPDPRSKAEETIMGLERLIAAAKLCRSNVDLEMELYNREAKEDSAVAELDDNGQLQTQPQPISGVDQAVIGSTEQDHESATSTMQESIVIYSPIMKKKTPTKINKKPFTKVVPMPLQSSSEEKHSTKGNCQQATEVQSTGQLGERKSKLQFCTPVQKILDNRKSFEVPSLHAASENDISNREPIKISKWSSNLQATKSILKSYSPAVETLPEEADIAELPTEVDKPPDMSKFEWPKDPPAKSPRFLVGDEALKHYENYINYEREKKKADLIKWKNNLLHALEDHQKKLQEALEYSKFHFHEPYKSDFSFRFWLQSLLRSVSSKPKLVPATPALHGEKIVDASPKNPPIEESTNTASTSSGSNMVNESIYKHFKKYSSRRVAWFTYIVTVIELLLVVIVLAAGKVTDIGLQSHTISSSKTMITFVGRVLVERTVIPNPWVGPDSQFFVNLGAVIAPCLRQDKAINDARNKYIATLSGPIGCCATIFAVGAATVGECDGYSGTWKAQPCSSLHYSSARVLLPCCVTNRAQCLLASPEHCAFLHGTSVVDGPEHCAQVDCVSVLCSPLGFAISPSVGLDQQLPAQHQWWRLLMSMWFFHGVIHAAFMLLLQLILMRRLELIVGPSRVCLLYVVCACIGQLAGSTFTPYIPQMGSDGAVSGLLATACLELAQCWHQLEWGTRAKELIKLAFVALQLFFVGTLTFVNNYASLGGFACGIAIGIVVCPTFTFGPFTVRRRQLLVAIGLVLLVAVVIFVITLFIPVQSLNDLCPRCRYFTCIPYVSNMCDDIPDVNE